MENDTAPKMTDQEIAAQLRKALASARPAIRKETASWLQAISKPR